MIADYAAPIGDMITLNDQIAQGTSDSGLVNDVRTLNSLSMAKDQAAQQRAILYNALTQQFFADGEQQALTTALSEQLVTWRRSKRQPRPPNRALSATRWPVRR